MEYAPPRQLTPIARTVWDRQADRIYNEGRWQQVDQDQLATYAETVEVYLRCKSEIDKHGVLVEGRTARELVRNPALTPLAQSRADLIRLSKAVPLVDYKADPEGAAVDLLLAELAL
jgi:P27 family predicted phage terminase small subunit